jgi:hypothetical protein
MFALSGIAEARKDVLVSKVGEVSKYFFLSHSGSKIGQHVVDGDPHAADAWLSAPFSRLDRDDAFVRHAYILLDAGMCGCTQSISP